MTQAIHDFLLKPTESNGAELCRQDLADLRANVSRHPDGMGSGRGKLSHACKRLVAHGMLEVRNGRTYATEYGIQVAKANASCIDGSDRHARPPAYHRETAAQDDQAVYPVCGIDDGCTDGELMFDALLESATADNEPSLPAKPAARLMSTMLTKVEFSRAWVRRQVMWVRLAVECLRAAVVGGWRP